MQKKTRKIQPLVFELTEDQVADVLKAQIQKKVNELNRSLNKTIGHLGDPSVEIESRITKFDKIGDELKELLNQYDNLEKGLAKVQVKQRVEKTETPKPRKKPKSKTVSGEPKVQQSKEETTP